jgi:protoporphyrinogen oxidase
MARDSDRHRPRIAVIGAGPMGLGAAHDLAERGAAVTVYERDDRLGGMSAHVDFAGTRLERYYHFVCGPDRPLFDRLAQLGLSDRLKWVETHMGFWHGGRLHDWGSPLSLLRFPGLSLVDKVRYGLHVLRAKHVRDWGPYDAFGATDWLRRSIGERAFEVVWKPLFHWKFYEQADDLSAAWLGTRIQRVAKSRASLSQERLGYLEGGSEVLLDALAARIVALGGRIELSAPVESVLSADGPSGPRAVGVRAGGVDTPFDAMVSTVPLPYVPRLVPALPAAERAAIEGIRSVGVVCVLLKLRQPFSRNFWTNINDPRIEIPGLIEYTNLNPLDGSHVLYAPFYMPRSHPKYARGPEAFVEETVRALALLKPGFGPSDVVASTASRYDHAQTVCDVGFGARLPPMRSALAGFFAADTSHYYPEDRSISESLRVGTRLADLAWQDVPRATAPA